MKKSRKPTKQRKAKAVPAATAPTRRSFMTMAPYVLGGIIVASGIGYLGISAVQADLAEQDLTNIGNGIPTIVQVHDPACSMCIALEKETRAAFSDIDDDDLAYRVASLTSDVGSEFAAQHTAGYATLLFFDAGGTLTQRLHGENDRATLETAFLAHIGGDQ
jgi:hypothetical protein